MDIFLLRQALPAPGLVEGRTRITAVKAETADDEPSEASTRGSGHLKPWMSRLASPAEGVVQGRTLSTKAIETSDDEP
jgi:hypothetical protein